VNLIILRIMSDVSFPGSVPIVNQGYLQVTMLLAGRSRVRFPMTSLDFSIIIILPAALCPWGRLRLLTELSTRNLTGSKGRSALKAANLVAISKPIV
jgi:hypothetical protein